jgi:hypothetical protein
MSLSTTYFVDRNITRAAKHLDLLFAALDHKLPREASKLRSLKAMVDENRARLADLAAQCPALTPAEFNRLVTERVQEIRQFQFAEVKRKRDARAQHEAERQELFATGAIAA